MDKISKTQFTFDENCSFKFRYKYYNFEKIETNNDRLIFLKLPTIISNYQNTPEFSAVIRNKVDKNLFTKLGFDNDWFNKGQIGFNQSKEGSIAQAASSIHSTFDIFNYTHFFFGIFVFDSNLSNNIGGCYAKIKEYVKKNEISSFFMICAKINQNELNSLIKDPSFSNTINSAQSESETDDKAEKAINIIPIKDITNQKDINNMLDNLKAVMIKEIKKKLENITKLNPNEWKAANRAQSQNDLKILKIYADFSMMLGCKKNCHKYLKMISETVNTIDKSHILIKASLIEGLMTYNYLVISANNYSMDNSQLRDVYDWAIQINESISLYFKENFFLKAIKLAIKFMSLVAKLKMKEIFFDIFSNIEHSLQNPKTPSYYVLEAANLCQSIGFIRKSCYLMSKYFTKIETLEDYSQEKREVVLLMFDCFFNKDLIDPSLKNAKKSFANLLGDSTTKFDMKNLYASNPTPGNTNDLKSSKGMSMKTIQPTKKNPEETEQTNISLNRFVLHQFVDLLSKYNEKEIIIACIEMLGVCKVQDQRTVLETQLTKRHSTVITLESSTSLPFYSKLTLKTDKSNINANTKSSNEPAEKKIFIYDPRKKDEPLNWIAKKKQKTTLTLYNPLDTPVEIDNIEFIYEGPKIIFYSSKVKLAPKEMAKKVVIYIKALTAGNLAIKGCRFFIKNLIYEVYCDNIGMCNQIKNDTSGIFNIQKIKSKQTKKITTIEIKQKFPQINILKENSNQNCKSVFFSCEDIVLNYNVVNTLRENFYIKNLSIKVQFENAWAKEYKIITQDNPLHITSSNGLSFAVNYFQGRSYIKDNVIKKVSDSKIELTVSHLTTKDRFYKTSINVETVCNLNDTESITNDETFYYTVNANFIGSIFIQEINSSLVHNLGMTEDFIFILQVKQADIEERQDIDALERNNQPNNRNGPSNYKTPKVQSPQYNINYSEVNLETEEENYFSKLKFSLLSTSGEFLTDLILSDEGKFVFKVYNQRDKLAFINNRKKGNNIDLIVQWEEIISRRKGVLLVEETNLLVNSKIETTLMKAGDWTPPKDNQKEQKNGKLECSKDAELIVQKGKFIEMKVKLYNRVLNSRWLCHLIAFNKVGLNDYLVNGDTIFMLEKENIDQDFEYIFFGQGNYKFYIISRNVNTKQVAINELKLLVKVN